MEYTAGSAARQNGCVVYLVNMRIETIFCPACRHKLSIPEELMGQPVQCPECRSTFVGPPLAPGSPDDRGMPRERSGPYFGSPEEFNPPPRRDEAGDSNYAALTMVAGLAMVAVSGLGLLVNGLKLLVAFSPQLLRLATQNNPMGAMPAGVDVKSLFLIMGFIFGMVSVVSLAGGLAMIRRRGYALAMLGSLAAIINIGDCCTFASPLVGVPALILLFLPAVRESFR